MTGAELASAAARLVGAPFRLHGRDPDTGLDCIGLLQAAMAAAGSRMMLPNGYSIRQREPPDLSGIARSSGFRKVSRGDLLAGDIVIMRPSACLIHLAIVMDGDRAVHAHAGLSKVVMSRMPLPWPVISHWRLRPISEC